jgi:hypothetical protein
MHARSIKLNEDWLPNITVTVVTLGTKPRPKQGASSQLSHHCQRFMQPPLLRMSYLSL